MKTRVVNGSALAVGDTVVLYGRTGTVERFGEAIEVLGLPRPPAGARTAHLSELHRTIETPTLSVWPGDWFEVLV